MPGRSSFFPPIAIVGQSCLLPGASSPAELWRLVADGRSALTQSPERRWRVPLPSVLASNAGDTRDRTISDRGGYVEGFDGLFDPNGFAIPASEIAGLDPLFRWLLHVGREALADAEYGGSLERAGGVIGNLSYPSASLSCFAERTWLAGSALGALGIPRADPRNRFMSGLPAHVLAQALGLGAGAFALDAACASSLYAIALACDRLHDGRADLMIAGAVNCADDLFIHVGFTALGALSPHGRSRPFDAAADGLVPAEGAAVVVLRRLEDAQRDGQRILGVIRGIGLSNDGRGRGFLVPSEDGQIRALDAAYRVAGIAPADVSLVECHATGTLVGDAVEVRSLAHVFAGRADPLPIGSLKANLGHLITAAGVAGLMKVLGALREGVLPPMPVGDHLNDALAGAPLRVLRTEEPWRASGPRRAAVSAFGFGGNNAHLIVEEPPPRGVASLHTRSHPPAGEPPSIAIVAIAAIAGSGACGADFAEALFLGRSQVVDGAAAVREVRLPLAHLRFPPRDLEATLPQQLLMLAVAREALHQTRAVPGDRTGVFVGMQCDAEICRHGARWRAAGWGDALDAPEAWLESARDGFIGALGAAGVVGAMPNIVANRLNSQFDLGGPSFAVSSEELSGVRALEIARRMLEHHEIDAAVVGAVDLSAEPVHRAAIAAVSPNRRPGGDAAVALVLKRLDDAQRDGDRIFARLSSSRDQADDTIRIGDGEGATSLEPLFGHPHAAAGLLSVAAGALCCAYGVAPRLASRVRHAVATAEAIGGQRASVALDSPPDAEQRGPIDESALMRELAEWRRACALDTPTLTFAAHQPPPVIPPVAARTPEEPPQPMPVPPPNPSLEIDVAVVPAARPAAALGNAVAARHARYHGEVAALHLDHLDTQARLHQQFIESRQRSVELLLSNRGLIRTAPALAAAPVAIAPPAAVARRTRFSRQDLETHASGRISDIFGPRFADQDRHEVQVRMPEPPLLLADRVVGLDAEPGSMGLGTVWTETDIGNDSWYLNRGYMPAGVMIEAGQADLFLISYLGVDALNQGQRAYRLLGCELTYKGSLPARGQTLRYDIHVDGHAQQGDVRLFSFHYDCLVDGRPGLLVRHGQAGFFSREDLDQSAGVLWSPDTYTPRDGDRLDPPAVPHVRRDYSASAIEAFSRGDLFGCFGAGYELGQAHVRSPAIQNAPMLLVEEIRDLDPRGGPWKRGYLKAVTTIHPDDWFFVGHFKNDPCMPGTLMFEGCLQAMSFYLAALGFTLDRDGWRFEPVPDVPYTLRCRGQVLPASKQLVCELFVEEVHAGPFPTLYADLLGTVDGLKAFHARRVGLRLVPDWPLSTRLDVDPAHATPAGDDAHAAPQAAAPVATRDGFRFDYRSLLACAWGRPSEAFGRMYDVFDGTRRVARLPGPPYHFMSRVVRIDAAPECKPGGRIEIEYDVPVDAWYFGQNGCGVMPFCVLLETVLQPCGWLASYVGSALLEEDDLSFRNLDGTGIVRAEIPPGTRTLRTSTRLTTISRSGGMILESFEVRCHAGETLVYELDTGFGFFPKAALENQVGLPVTPEHRRQLDAPSDFMVDLTARQARFFEGSPRLPGPMLLMIDRVTAFDRAGGRAGLGCLRAEKRVDPSEWFFKAHFFQDPVQPGSLGLEAMLQLLQFYMIHEGLGGGAGRFEPIAIGRPMTWKYRGQVVPRDRVITITMDIVETGEDAAGSYALADASLWIDGRRIYQAVGMGMRIVNDAGVAIRGTWRQESPAEFLPQVAGFWREWFGASVPIVSDFYRGLIARFVGRFVYEDRGAFDAASRGPVLFVANHQTAVESTVFAIVMSAIAGAPLPTIAKIENRQHWLDLLMHHTFAHPLLRDPAMSLYFDRNDRESLLRILSGYADEMIHARRSLMVHVEGTRARTCRHPVDRMSGTLLDLAVRVGANVVPVRFTGGLPAEALAARAELPAGLGRQDVYVGRPIAAETLRALGYRERIRHVVSAINALGPPNEAETPLRGDAGFEDAVKEWMRLTGVDLGHAAVFRTLDRLADASPETRRVTGAARAGVLEVGGSPEEAWLAEFARRLFGPRGPRITRTGGDR